MKQDQRQNMVDNVFSEREEQPSAFSESLSDECNKLQTTEANQSVVPSSKKRKRKQFATKTTFDEHGAAHTTPLSSQESSDSNLKYIVFVGNMSYDVAADELAKHMEETCGEKPKVRLLTKKADPALHEKLSNSKKKSIAKGKARDPSAPVSRGCAFVEFTNANSLQKALRFHHTMFRGRQINVELTAGGGGKSERRTEKIKAKNAGLDKERRKLFEKYVKPGAEAHKQKQLKGQDGQRASTSAENSDRSTSSKFKYASGANAVRLG